MVSNMTTKIDIAEYQFDEPLDIEYKEKLYDWIDKIHSAIKHNDTETIESIKEELPDIQVLLDWYSDLDPNEKEDLDNIIASIIATIGKTVDGKTILSVFIDLDKTIVGFDEEFAEDMIPYLEILVDIANKLALKD